MAYRKVCDAQTGPLVGDVLHCSGGLDLDWDLDKEDLQDPGPSMEQHVDCQIAGCSDPGPDPDPELMEPIQPSVSVSPHGRFERLQEDPNYISHFTRAPGHKGQRRLQCFLLRYFLAGLGLFVLGLLIGWFTHTPTAKPPVPPSDSSDLLEELLKGIAADKIDALQRQHLSTSLSVSMNASGNEQFGWQKQKETTSLDRHEPQITPKRVGNRSSVQTKEGFVQVLKTHVAGNMFIKMCTFSHRLNNTSLRWCHVGLVEHREIKKR